MTAEHTPCEHENFGVNANVARVTDKVPMRFVLECTAWCMDCGQKFGFIGLPRKISSRAPGMSATRLRVTLPIEPIDAKAESQRGGNVEVDAG